MMKKRLLTMLVLLAAVATGAVAQTTYIVSVKEGTEDASNWQGKAGEGEYQALPLEGVAANTAVSVKYNGTKKVKSVKAVKKGGAEPVDNTYLKWNADQLVKTDIPAEVTTVANADTDVNWAAGTYVVDGEVTINGTITLEGNVNLIIKDDAKLTVNKINGNSKNLSIYGQAQKTGQLVVNCSDNNAISGLSTLEVHSAKVTATASKSGCGGFRNIVTFNVYGGLVDAKGTVANGYGICMDQGGSMNIYGGEVKAEGKGSGSVWSCAILYTYSGYAPVTVFGGKLYAENADYKALFNIDLTKDNGYTSGKIQTCDDGSSWADYTGATTPTTKYVRVGY